MVVSGGALVLVELGGSVVRCRDQSAVTIAK